MELNLKDKVAIVTGANRGIGAGVAQQLALEGMNVALVARDAEKLGQTADSIRQSTGREVITLPCDLRVPEAATAVVEQTFNAFGRIDLLVNNAGATRRADFFDLTDEDWQDGLALKLHGYVRMTRAVWPRLVEVQGTIVNIVGIGAWTGVGEFTIGGVVNAALMNFTKAMADIGKRDGVRVCAVNPGRIQTDRLTRNIQRIAEASSLDTEEATVLLLKECGIKRFGTPDEIGHAVAFLASGAATFAQGAILDVDGGETRAI
ncbi:SDR family oxidoreductase [Paraburkholderia sp. BCC1885]|uniref:SDR family oxidoreductase n=1 Tax=Paraburkholderia sp. BCC1885 TaxID=2562669 RepID=UPI001182F0DF|nr:SDR family oxidoreductase [Paraburkholderia sp. BCC1885]